MTDTIEKRALEDAALALSNKLGLSDVRSLGHIGNALTAFAQAKVERALEEAAETCEALSDGLAPIRGAQRSTILRAAAEAIRTFQNKDQGND